ncbi:hypothetical protein V6M85_06595 [Sulfolobus tengchongensis]|uniref:Transposase n=1 Tax=Sulfolobus tengchongensis TaxID=207809 RepID=A0AAX4KW96_9CREN
MNDISSSCFLPSWNVGYPISKELQDISTNNIVESFNSLLERRRFSQVYTPHIPQIV